jgi:hypothetical protein
VAKVEWHPGELCPRVGFIVTNLARPAERIVGFYNHRGTCEQYIKEGKGAIKWTRLSCRSFAANAVRLQLHALAYNLGNFMRTLAMPKTAEPWSLTSLREKLIKIGAKVVSHGRYVTFQLAEVAVSRQMFADNPDADRPAAATARTSMNGESGRMDGRRRQRCALITEKRRVLDSRTGTPAVWPRTEAVAIEFGCGGTSRDGGSGLTGGNPENVGYNYFPEWDGDLPEPVVPLSVV